MARIILGLLVLVLATVVLWIGAYTDPGSNLPDILLNLGTELLGIVITVMLVDWLFELRRTKEQAREVATQALHELDHLVWVWQGGNRMFDFAELRALLTEIGPDDPIPPFTENLFLQLSSKAAEELNLRPLVVKANKQLKYGLESLLPLQTLRDSQNRLYNREIARCLLEAAEALGLAAGYQPLPEPKIKSHQRYRKKTVDAQEWRHFGEKTCSEDDLTNCDNSI